MRRELEGLGERAHVPGFVDYEVHQEEIVCRTPFLAKHVI